MILQTQVDNLKNQLDSFRGIFFKRGIYVSKFNH